jgi:hypothetical protein
MNLTIALVLMVVTLTTMGLLRLISLRIRNRQARRRRMGVVAVSAPPRRIRKDHLRWVNLEELLELINTDPELTLFCLGDGGTRNSGFGCLAGNLCVTLQELEEALPWIPAGSTLAIYHSSGIGPVLGRRLSSMLCGRKAIVLSEPMSPTEEKFSRVAGALCQ